MERLIDRRDIFRAAWPSYGPDWDAAIEFGIDIALLERNLRLTPAERLEQHPRAQHGARDGTIGKDIQDSSALLRRLVDANVEFVVVGGLAAFSHGVPRARTVLEICAVFSSENMGRLLSAVIDIDPRDALRPDLPTMTNMPEDLVDSRDMMIATALGHLDVLRTLPAVGDYTRVMVNAVHLETYAIVGLDDLLRSLKFGGLLRDREVVAELEAIRERQRAR